MKDQLISYVDLLFAGAEDAEDIKQEILQNTLDRYDDLLSQGKSPQAAYSLAISGIGDISELLQSGNASTSAKAEIPQAAPVQMNHNWRLMRAVSIGMYICCPAPIIMLANMGKIALGVVLMFLLFAAATVLMILSNDGKKAEKSGFSGISFRQPKDPFRKSVNNMIKTVGLCAYFIISFATGAWNITWLILLIMAAAEQLVNAIMDLKEA